MTCERDDFCVLPNGHPGECDQPFHDPATCPICVPPPHAGPTKLCATHDWRSSLDSGNPGK